MENSKDAKLFLEDLEDSLLENPQPNSPPEGNIKIFKQGSLVALTQKFLTLIHDGKGVVDLNFVSRKKL